MRTCETSSSVFQTIAASRRTGLPAGKVVFHSADGDEEFVEGDAYYVLPGHTPEIIAGTEVVEFSTERLKETIAVATKNMQAGGS